MLLLVVYGLIQIFMYILILLAEKTFPKPKAFLSQIWVPICSPEAMTLIKQHESENLVMTVGHNLKCIHLHLSALHNPNVTASVS